ncbi:MAG TPA: TetR/AcrR family transcriptional regulator [Thermoanaerobaculia bacterium]|jgi:TetR/AcrR family fatty acid metabolism transcriptional regulator|nr:TetR/AcrR family transcriptional regulator [Thermoanaerobaculia bacterium]
MARKTKEEVLEEFRCGSIQDAAMAVIARKGIDDTTIQDIADEAGIAKGTVYVYFRDREELLAKTADRLFGNLLGELTPAFDAPGSFAARLRGLVRRQLRFFDEHKALFRATMALSHREAESHKGKTRFFAQYMAKLEATFTDAAASGELRAGLDPHAVAAVYRDCVRGVILRRLDPKLKTKNAAEDDAEFIVSLFLRGVHAGEGR